MKTILIAIASLALAIPAHAQQKRPAQGGASQPSQGAKGFVTGPGAKKSTGKDSPEPTPSKSSSAISVRREREPATMNELVARIAANGCDLRPADVLETKRREVAAQLGIDTAPLTLYRVGDASEGGVALIEFKSKESPQRVARINVPAGLQYAAYGRFLLVKCCTNKEWKSVRSAMPFVGASFGSSPSDNEPERRATQSRQQRVLAQLATLRSSIERFKLKNAGRVPDLASAQWQPLIGAGLISQAPKNVLCPDPASQRVVPGTSGADVDRTRAGWAFDPSTGSLFAAGIDE